VLGPKAPRVQQDLKGPPARQDLLDRKARLDLLDRPEKQVRQGLKGQQERLQKLHPVLSHLLTLVLQLARNATRRPTMSSTRVDIPSN
jgi:hypothetical protein